MKDRVWSTKRQGIGWSSPTLRDSFFVVLKDLNLELDKEPISICANFLTLAMVPSNYKLIYSSNYILWVLLDGKENRRLDREVSLLNRSYALNSVPN